MCDAIGSLCDAVGLGRQTHFYRWPHEPFPFPPTVPLLLYMRDHKLTCGKKLQFSCDSDQGYHSPTACVSVCFWIGFLSTSFGLPLVSNQFHDTHPAVVELNSDMPYEVASIVLWKSNDYYRAVVKQAT